MLRSRKYIVLIISAVFLLSIIFGCNYQDSKTTYNLERFQNDMAAKKYNFIIEDTDQNFIPTTRKRMIFDNMALDIYLFENNQQMEKEARYIDNSGFNYNNGSAGVNVSWVSLPHFYKKGSIIVQYIGEDEKITTDLEDILGEQFAVYTPK
jgi:hypothetical protein